ncbi:ERF family protein [Bacteroides clarus]
MAEIYQAIIGVMSDIGVIGKEKRNTQQGFKYRGVDDVMNALQPVMVQHGLFVVPEIIDQKREERQTKNKGNLIYSVCTVRYTFYAKDGSSVQCVVIGEGMDSGDKATNKAMSIAFKYACFQVFCIPTEEMKEITTKMDDPDAEIAPQSKPVERNDKQTAVQIKAKKVKQLLYDISGKDADASSKLWREQYQKDENDIVKMNAAILELEPKWNAIKAEQHKAVQNDA